MIVAKKLYLILAKHFSERKGSQREGQKLSPRGGHKPHGAQPARLAGPVSLEMICPQEKKKGGEKEGSIVCYIVFKHVR